MFEVEIIETDERAGHFCGCEGKRSPDYYVKRDEWAPFDLAMKDLRVQADNLFEMGVGGAEAVRANTLRTAEKIGAKTVFLVDLSRGLAEQGVEIVEAAGQEAVAVISDMFQRLPVIKSDIFISALGQELGNLETYDHPHEVEARLTEILSHYAAAIASRDGRKSGHLLISYDANRNINETRACYFNAEFGGLVRSLVGRKLGDTDFFDYDVVVRQTPDMDFLATGLRANCDRAVPFNGKDFHIKEGDFYPVLNSSRFSVPFMTRAAAKAGWRSEGIWSATGRVHYQHFKFGRAGGCRIHE